jgi:phosphomannomutase/phosphoglucomutase
MSVSQYSEVFGAYDVRGVVGATLNAEFAYRFGRALGTEALARNGSAVVVARDGRLSSPLLSAALIDGISASGCNVLDIGEVPSPVLYFAVDYLQVGGGVMVTASHNPPQYNGFKVVLEGMILAHAEMRVLRERMEAEGYRSGAGEVRRLSVDEAYLSRSLQSIDIERRLRVVVDGGDGVAGPLAVQLLQRLGCEVIPLYCSVDGRFPHHSPDPSDPETLRSLIDTVRQQHADLGIALDGDGDRLGVVDGRGKIIWPDRLLMFFARDVLAAHPGAPVLFDVKCTNLLEREICRCGGEPIMWQSGHSLLRPKLRQLGGPLAGEYSGHVFFADRWFGFDDGLYAAARLLELLARDPRSPSEIFAQLPEAVGTPELRLMLPAGQPAFLMRGLRDSLSLTSGGRVTLLDGVRIDFTDAWGLVRASNTLPCLIFRFEAASYDRLAEIQAIFRRAMAEVAPALILPF